MRVSLATLVVCAALAAGMPRHAMAEMQPAAKPAPPPAEYGAEARMLYRAVACGALTEPVPAHLPKKVVDASCKELDRVYKRFHKKWADIAAPFIAKLRPANLPKSVVYPFGGGDLLFAHVTFPDATELTSISLELAGDAGVIAGMDKGDFKLGLADAVWMIVRLAGVEYSFTEHMEYMQGSRLPVQLCLALAALAAMGYEPVGLRYFVIEADGSLRYLTRAEIDSGAAEHAKKQLDGIAPVFGNAELTFRKVGDASAPLKTYRSIAANLHDSVLGGDARVIKHLEKKGPVAGMVKAASYLLWRDDFSIVRNYLLANVVWMISDSTGPLPMHAGPAGLVQEAYGQFKGSMLGTAKDRNKDMLKLWKDQPARAVPFRFGYPDYEKKGGHLLITRRKP
jgi:hypothetical protein